MVLFFISTCGYSSEVHWWGTSNEYSQHIFLKRTEENYPIIITKYSFLTILLNCTKHIQSPYVKQSLCMIPWSAWIFTKPYHSHSTLINQYRLIVLGFNDMSTLEGHFVSSPREREKRDRRESRGDEREGQGRKRNRNESEETEEIKTFPLYPYPLQG